MSVLTLFFLTSSAMWQPLSKRVKKAKLPSYKLLGGNTMTYSWPCFHQLRAIKHALALSVSFTQASKKVFLGFQMNCFCNRCNIASGIDLPA